MPNGKVFVYNGQVVVIDNGVEIRIVAGDGLIPENIAKDKVVCGVVGTAPTPIGDLADYTWTQIVDIIKSGDMPYKWIGQVKEITGADGNKYNLTIADGTEGRYEFSDGTYNHAVIQFVTSKNYTGQMGGNNVTFEGTSLFSQLQPNGSIFENMLSSELKDIVKSTKVRVNSTHTNSAYNLASTKLIETYLIVPSLGEITGIRTGAYYGSIYMKETFGCKNNALMGQFTLFQKSALLSDSVPIEITSNTQKRFWTRTADQSNQARFIVIGTDGYGVGLETYNSNVAIAPCFAI